MGDYWQFLCSFVDLRALHIRIVPREEKRIVSIMDRLVRKIEIQAKNTPVFADDLEPHLMRRLCRERITKATGRIFNQARQELRRIGALAPV
jgi:hypothetical protein